jgi:hypothetical protein
MEPDYPAAHSMDTSWYAVDRDGHVAIFSSGEAGAVPMTVSSDEDREVSEQLRETLPEGGVTYDLSSRFLPSLEDDARRLDRAWLMEYPVLLFLSALDPVRDALAAGRAEQVEATEGVAVILRGLSEEELNGYRDSPHFRGCINLYLGEEFATSLAHHGLYEYGHITENWISGPYGREMLPQRPLHIDQLPPDLRRRIGCLRLPLRFADTPRIQPVELAGCVSWGPAYLDVTGRHIRPIPGMEDEYAEAYQHLVQLKGMDIQVEPPPGGE